MERGKGQKGRGAREQGEDMKVHKGYIDKVEETKLEDRQAVKARVKLKRKC